MGKYAITFDVKMFAGVRCDVEADTPKKALAIAKAALPRALECFDLSDATLGGINSMFANDGLAGVKITAATLSADDGGIPYEIEGDAEDDGEITL